MDKKNFENDVIEIDLKELIMALLSHSLIIILSGLLTAAIGFAVSNFLIAPTYESTTKIYILNKQENATITYADVQVGTQLTKDYAELIQSRFVLEQVIDNLSLSNISYENLANKIKITSPTDTRIIAITVSSGNPMEAMRIANEIRETAATHIKNVMDIEAVNIVETANLPTGKSGPSILKWTALGGILGLFLLLIVFTIRYLINDNIKNADDIEKYLGLSTLALIPITKVKNA